MTYRDPGPDPLAVDPELMAHAQAVQRKRAIAAVMGVALVAAVGVGVASMVSSRQDAKESEEAVAKLSTCLLADPATEAPTKLVRASQLAELNRPAATERWPGRCAAYARGLADHAKRRGLPALASSSTKLGLALDAPESYAADLQPVTARVFDEIAKAKIARRATEGVPKAPAPSAHLTLATLPDAAQLLPKGTMMRVVHPAPFPSQPLRLVFDEAGLTQGPLACRLDAKEKALLCHKVTGPAASKSPSLRLWGTTARPEQAPLLFAGNRGTFGVFRSDTGAEVVGKLKNGAYGASLLDDGTFAYLDWNDQAPQIRLFRGELGGSFEEVKLLDRKDTGNPYYATAMFFGTFLFKSRNKDDGIHLMARRIEGAKDKPATGPAVDVGRIGEIGRIDGGDGEEPHLVACRPGERDRADGASKRAPIAIKAKGWDHSYITFMTDAETPGEAPRFSPPVASTVLWGDLYCRGGEAVLVANEGESAASGYWPSVVVSRCSASGCKDTTMAFKKSIGQDPLLAPASKADVQGVELAGKLLFVWRAASGGLRMRLGPAEQLASAEERVLFDDHAHDDGYRAEPTLLEFQVLSSGTDAVLLLNTTRGLYGFVIDGAGAVAPLAIKVS
ncbi:MAG TPA: hypothetical protein PK141_11905 [Polyangiaceae bacterium]|nr:hypothetical protein [Polyangiaceae bacterium]